MLLYTVLFYSPLFSSVLLYAAASDETDAHAPDARAFQPHGVEVKVLEPGGKFSV